MVECFTTEIKTSAYHLKQWLAGATMPTPVTLEDLKEIFVVASFTCLFYDCISVHKIKLFKRWSKQVNFGAGMVAGFTIATLAVVVTSFWYDL